MSPSRQLLRHALSRVPPWLGVPMAILLAAILGVSVFAVIARVVF